MSLKKDSNKEIKLEQASIAEMKVLYPRLRKIIEKHKNQTHSIKIRIQGKYLWIDPNVFNPRNGKISLSLIDCLQLKQKATILDVGTGCGMYGIFSIYKGASKAVLVDISPNAVSCAKKNVSLHKMEDKIDVREGDIFTPIKKGEKFDLIISNPPFFREENGISAIDDFDRFFMDKKEGFIYKFLSNAREYLKKDGKILLVYGKSGFVKDLAKLIDIYRYTCKIIKTKYREPDAYYILELKPKF